MTGNSYLPPGEDLADFVKNAPMHDIINQIYHAAVKMQYPFEHHNIEEGARRTRCFLDEMPIVLQAAFERGYCAGFLAGVTRTHEPMQ